ncbi:hypothetical protein ASG25_10815 [Rhizobium sp. Leaf384]|uniref:hypothetical protein n=1 Tax=Rhizobium sp. Leaf384 TaxID=1736358 RepID=UPI0007131694|nr:hypothetical protein [Rhizobium sp. Leaf384]KQS79069.1 hypothetical protein ASG25_10815 [Rhizobium sp. Leaf384]
MIERSANRYALRRDPDGTWAIEDIFTGQTAEIGDEPQEGLALEIADYLVDVLNLEYINRRRGTTH